MPRTFSPNSKGSRLFALMLTGITVKEAAHQVGMTINAARTALGRRGFLYARGELRSCRRWPTR